MANPVVTAATSACLLTRQAGSFFSASAGTVTLTLTDNNGNTVFDCTHCVLNNTTNEPGTRVPMTCAAKQISFTLLSGHKYTLQLMFTQVPTPGSSADLKEAPCGQVLDTIDDTNQSQIWNIQA
jgi:hypothetical protein